jgi:D-methionine transport system ATP-binding protein
MNPFLPSRSRKGFYFSAKEVKTVIRFQEVSKVFQAGKGKEVRALDRVSLTIRRGDIFGIIGHSGAGKSTLLRMINGLEIPTSGSVTVDQRIISGLSNRELRNVRQKIGMIFQHFHLLWSRTVRENVAFPLEVAGVPKSEIKAKVDRLLERVGLAEKADVYPAQLSGGQKQRVGIARALANDPDILLCDEATSALDPETTAAILELLKEIHRETGITLVLITHEMSVVRAICNRMAVMENGRIVEEGDVEEIFRAPKHPLTRQFLREWAKGGGDFSGGEECLVPLFLIPELEKWTEKTGAVFRIVGGTVAAGRESRIPVQVFGSEEQIRQVKEWLSEVKNRVG